VKELTLRSSPTTLPNVKPTSHGPGIHLARRFIHKRLLRLDDRSRLALVIHTQHLASYFEALALGCHRERLEELELALAVKDMLGVELGDAINRRAVGARVEIDHFLVCMLKGKDDGVGWEGSEVGVKFLLQVNSCTDM
jgi:hypothetical protein